nr:EOG090X0KP6 [Macrothrix elegans]
MASNPFGEDEDDIDIKKLLNLHIQGDSGLAGTLETSANSSQSKNTDNDLSLESDDDFFFGDLSNESSNSAGPSQESAKSSAENEIKLTAFQKARIERNRQRALLLRQARLQAHPYRNSAPEEYSVIRVQNSRLIDSGGGFLIDEEELEKERTKEVVITEDPAPIIIPERPHCDECEQPIHDSYLYRSFNFPVCDSCRDDEDKHSLITRTDARQEFLLKDCDLDLREPILKFILRKNPHNPRWGDMKLYLRSQIEARALEVWGSIEKIEEERELREAKREKSKIKKFNKELKTLRMAVRSSVYTKQTASHEHTYGPEKYDEDRDIYFKACNKCSHKQEYEKM